MYERVAGRVGGDNIVRKPQGGQDPCKRVSFAVINGIKIHGFSEETYLKALTQD